MEFGHRFDIDVFGGFPLTLPSRKLPLDIGLLASEVAEPDGIDINRVNLCEDLDQGLAGVRSRLEGKN